MSERRVVAGDILARKYRVERVLGAGNMGVVVAATHVELGQLVALKMMLPDKEQTPEMRERFLREARAAVRLKSQHVARVLDVGADEHDAPYIAMEFLAGKDLSETLKTRGPLPFDEAIEYILQACEAVGEAHTAGVIHRDLKPANLFLAKDVSGAPCVKVLDFGISKLLGAELALTQDAQALGSPLYMSPEALGSAKNVDARTDIWALGIILYQLVAGRTPFHESSMAQLCMRIVSGEPTPLSDYRADAPRGFEAVILRCLERDRDKRFENVAAFAGALLPFASARARGYIDRIARVMGVDPASVAAQVDLSEMQSTMPLVAAGSRAPFASVPAMSAAGATSQAAVIVPAPQASGMSSRMDSPVKPKRRAPIVIGVILALAIPGTFLALRALGSSTKAAPAPAAESPAAATSRPVASESAITPTVATQAADVAPEPSATATPVQSAVKSQAAGTTTKTTTKPTTKSAPVISYDERE